ncbi:MAG: prolyl oligopeptidase family serine peptidase [Acidimicrobiia bacterium]|nr:prolyl oligopeptidase family serine peptidase [Acidimicrobiia bacterium]
MRLLALGIVVLAAACSGTGATEETTTTTTSTPATTTTVDADPLVAFVGEERPSRLVIPPAWEADGEPLPLVVLLHGYTATGELQDLYLGVSSTGSDLGYLTLTPDGTTDERGNQFWNATDFEQFVDDAGYLEGLIDEVIAGYNADPDRVYLVGHSNGGFMANKLACDIPDRIAGIAAIAGGVFGTGSDCLAPMRVLFIQGTDDGTVPFEGGVFLGGRVLGAQDTVDLWRGAGECTDASATKGPFDYDLLVPGEETTITVWEDCAPSASVELWSMEGSGHIPGFLPAFRSAMMERLLGIEDN